MTKVVFRNKGKLDLRPSLRGAPWEFIQRVNEWKRTHPEHARYTPKGIVQVWVELGLVELPDEEGK